MLYTITNSQDCSRYRKLRCFIFSYTLYIRCFAWANIRTMYTLNCNFHIIFQVLFKRPFSISYSFVPFLFSHPPYSHLLRSYRENKIANLVRRGYEEDTRKVRRKNYCSFFRFPIFRKNREYFTDISLLPLQEPLVGDIKNGYTLCLGWLHPLVQMATPSGTKGVALAKAELPNNLKVR